MARVFTLSSGSEGNCAFVGDGQCAVLIDVGISFSKIKSSLQEYGLDFSKIKALLITHEHSDHIKGLSTFCKKTQIPVFASPKTADYIILQHPELEERIERLKIGEKYIIDKMAFTAFSLYHDSNEAVGYRVITADNRIVALSTDTGMLDEQIFLNLCNADLNIIEANFDENMLACNISYPFLLKQRISGNYGHLSNKQCAEIVCKLMNNGCGRFLLAHLSAQNNTPDVALESVKIKLAQDGFVEGRDFEISVAPRFDNSRMLIF